MKSKIMDRFLTGEILIQLDLTLPAGLIQAFSKGECIGHVDLGLAVPDISCFLILERADRIVAHPQGASSILAGLTFVSGLIEAITDMQKPKKEAGSYGNTTH